MKVKTVLKKRTNLFLGSCILIVLAVVITFVAVFKWNGVNTKVTINNKNLQVVYKNNNEKVNKSLEVMSFQQGIKKIKAELIEVVNKKDFSTEFFVCIQQVDVSSDNLTLDKLYYKINNSTGIVGEQDDNCIYYRKLEPKERVLLNVKVWIGKELIDNKDQGKTIEYKYYIK